MSLSWFRMYAEFATDAKVQSMPETMQRRLVMLFCLRCSDVTVTLCDEELAFQLRISEQELAETKALFMRKGFIDSEWNPKNWDKRQYASDSSAERTRRYRERVRDAAVTSHVTNSDALDTDTDTDKKTMRAKRGTRLPDDWKPSKDELQWAMTERTDIAIGAEVERFRDYWIAQPGAKGVKLDWSATWRNWVRNARHVNGTAAPTPTKTRPFL